MRGKTKGYVCLLLTAALCLSLLPVGALAEEEPAPPEEAAVTVEEPAAEPAPEEAEEPAEEAEEPEEPAGEEPPPEEPAGEEEPTAIQEPAEEPMETEEPAETEEPVAEEPAETEKPVAEEPAAPVLDGDTTSFTVGYYTYSVVDGAVVLSKYNGMASSVTIPTSVTYNGTTYRIRKVGANAFEGNTYLKTLVIPDGITSLGNCAFKNCTSLSSITINGNIADCDGGSVRNDSGARFYNCSVFYNAGANANSLTVTFSNGVTYIPAYLFATAASKSDGTYAHVTKVVMPDSVATVGKGAFYNCHELSTITMGTGLQTIEDYGFYACTGLKILTMGSGLQTIGNYGFYGCTSLSTVTWGSNLSKIGEYAFAGDTSLKTVSLPSKLAYVEAHAFEGCTGMTVLTLPQKTQFLRNCAFKNCTSLSSITINGNIADCDGGSVRNDSGARFYNCSVFYNAGANANSLTVTFSSGVTYIPAYLFATAASKSDGTYAHVTDVVISNSVTEIGECAFYHCHDLKGITWGSGIETVGDNAFSEVTAEVYGFESGAASGILKKGGGTLTPVGTNSRDVNQDGTVNVFDVTRLIQYITNPSKTTIGAGTGDVNGDGAINLFDVTSLVSYIVHQA